MNPPRHDAPRYAVGGDSLIIGLDFGTTFSGVAYAYSTDPENIWTISDWPGGEDRLVPKAPSVLKYEDGSTTSFQWGYQLDLTRDANITELKLLLDPDQPRPYFISSNVQAEMARLPKGVMDVASDYMRVMLQHAVKQIEKEVMDRSILDNYQKKFVLTVPAVWSDKAKDLTLRAARNAGISPVSMITEPEAASLYTMYSNGDIIVICDAGGGTVDLVSYEIQSLDPFELKALTAPSGGLCGSLMLNKRFEDEVLQAVGDEAYVKLKKTDAYRSALKEFDTVVKIAFRGKNDPDRFVSFPMADLKDNTAAGLVKNAMALSGSTMFRIFDPIIREIDKLVSDQVTRVRLERLQLGDTTKASVKVGESRQSSWLVALEPVTT
ncbi:Hsp70 family protein, partial [Metarhizium hybridum]